MKIVLTLITCICISVWGSHALAQPFYVAGDFNGWDATSLQMYDDGTNGDALPADGIYSLRLPISIAGSHEWKVTEFDWANSWPASGNSWFQTTAENEEVLFTFNTNTMGDGWLSDGYWPFTDHSLSLTLVGNLQDELGDPSDWNNAGGLLLHDDGLDGDQFANDGYYTFRGTIATAGTYEWKIVSSGTWNAIGADGAGVNAANMLLDVPAASTVYFVLDSHLGRLYGSTESPVANEVTSWGAVKELYR